MTSAPETTIERPSGPDSTGTVVLTGVTKRYGDQTAVDDLSLEIEAGEFLSLLGPSGCGKTTLLNIISGLVKPSHGRVLFDGQDLAQLEQAARRAAISMVFQHPYLFDGSLRDNILIGDPDAGERAYRAATALARVDELTGRLPDGDRTAVGEAGSALSGGERQRVSIARALLKPAPVLLVDEATSALDTENEAAVVAALTADLRDRTRVIIAHRLASIQGAERVLFVEGGRIVEDGSIDELLAAGGRFARFWTEQTDASAWQVAGR